MAVFILDPNQDGLATFLKKAKQYLTKFVGKFQYLSNYDALTEYLILGCLRKEELSVRYCRKNIIFALCVAFRSELEPTDVRK